MAFISAFSSLCRRKAYLLLKHRMGSSFYPYFQFMRTQQFRSWEENQAYQKKALKTLIKAAYKRVPYYRKPFEEAGLIQSEDDDEVNLAQFGQLPPLTKDEVRIHGDLLLSLDAPLRKRIMKMPTGGTTGEPIHPYGDLEYWDWCLAQTWLCYNWIGLELGMPYFYYWGAAQDFGRKKGDWRSKLLLDVLQNQFLMNCSTLSEEKMAQFIWQINRMPQHQYMVAYTHELYTLACFSQDNHLPIARPLKGILVTTSVLTEDMRQTIESVFGCPVYSRYGCREVGDLACECEHQNGYHINPFYAHVEVVDDTGDPVPPGTEGRVLVTNLHNTLMPLIRYEIQDLAMLKEPRPCRCGRQWVTLTQITGRVHEKLHLPDGSTFGNVFLHYTMDSLPHVRGYQFHQLNINTVEVHLISPVNNYLEKHWAEVKQAYERIMDCTGNQLNVIFRQVPALEKSPSGKQLLIVNKLHTSGTGHQTYIPVGNHPPVSTRH